jgi:hypothetical protein
MEAGGDATSGMEAGGDATSGMDAGLDASLRDTAPDQTMVAESGADQTAGDTGSDTGADTSSMCTVPDAAMLDSASVEAGFYAVWQVYKCYSCHQRKTSVVDSLGNGIVLSGNNDGLGDSGTVFPPNLTSDPTTGLGCWTDSQVVDAILNGTTPDGGQLCPSMPLWGKALPNVPPDGGVRLGTPMDAETAQEIVDFLRSLPVVSNAVPDTMCAMTDAGGGDAAGDAAADSGGDAAMDGGIDASDAANADAADAAATDVGADVTDAGVDATNEGDGAME